MGPPGSCSCRCSRRSVEGLVHRWCTTRRSCPRCGPSTESTTRVHHYVSFPTWRYVTCGPPRRVPVYREDRDRAEATGAGQRPRFHLGIRRLQMISAGLIWVPCVLLGGGLPLLAGLVLASRWSCASSSIAASTTPSISRDLPADRRRSWFRFLDERRYVHHIDAEAKHQPYLYPPLRLALRHALNPDAHEAGAPEARDVAGREERLVGAGGAGAGGACGSRPGPGRARWRRGTGGRLEPRRTMLAVLALVAAAVAALLSG